MIKKYLNIIGLTAVTGFSVVSCTKDADSPGLEYMPDMYRSPAIEAYVDYGQIRDRENDSLKNVMSARIPVEGTITFSADPSKAQFNFPFGYKSWTEDANAYDSARVNLKNPIPYSPEVEAQGKHLYEIFCDHCHGETGEGDGTVVSWGKFPSPGSYATKYKETTEGQMFYTITYGKGLMGSHASQLNKEERWQVIHYVQTLQNGGTNPNAAGAEATVEVADTAANVAVETNTNTNENK